MAFTASDWSITRSNGNIRYIGDDHGGASPSYATVIELHRALQDFADDASASGDDELDITDSTPSDRSTDNIITLLNSFNIDDTAAEHLYDGSIIQDGGDDIYDGLSVIGASTNIQIIQNGAVLSDDWWNEDPDALGFGLNSDSANGLSHRFLIKVRTGGTDVDGRRVVFTSRNFSKNYGEFRINGTGRGINVVALTESDDLNNQTTVGTVAGFTDVTNTEGYQGIDASGDGVDEFYYSDWEYGSRSVNQFYERLKWLTREGSSSTVYGLNGELFRGITHEIDVDTPTGTFAAVEAVSWSGGTGQMLAINSTTAATKMWIQILTGVAPTDGQTITGASSATVDVDTTVTERAISTPFVGVSTGSAIIGAFGVGIGADDLTASDLVFDLTNTSVTPPNNVTFTVSGLVSGEDRILVAPEDGSGGLDLDQLSTSGTLNGAAVTTITVSTTIPSDTPASGTIRVLRDSGVYERIEYSSYSGANFTITSTDFSSDNATSGNNVFVSYIDTLAGSASESFTSVYSSDRTLFIRVRDGGASPIKTFETTGTLGSAGGSSTAIRTSDV
tara:strand:- start:6004 stop:7686 length:1683 start_codon:yes stop_codon:yes gene_type:complete